MPWLDAEAFERTPTSDDLIGYLEKRLPAAMPRAKARRWNAIDALLADKRPDEVAIYEDEVDIPPWLWRRRR